MFDSESGFESEPNAFEGESPDRQKDTDSEESDQHTESDSGSDVEVVGERVRSVPTHGIGKGLMTSQPTPLAVVYSDGRQVDLNLHSEPQAGDARVPGLSSSYRSEASTSGRGKTTEPPSQPKVMIVHRGNPMVPMGVPKEHLFGVDYLSPTRCPLGN